MSVCSQINTDWNRTDITEGYKAFAELTKALSCLLLSIRNIVIVIAILFMMYGAIKYLSSNGNPDKAKSARGTVTWALVALLLAVSLTFIINFIFNSLLGVPILSPEGTIKGEGIKDLIETFK